MLLPTKTFETVAKGKLFQKRLFRIDGKILIENDNINESTDPVFKG